MTPAAELPVISRDQFGRAIEYLRISVTDRCNFRCVYCRSADPENYRHHDEILSWPELLRLAGLFKDLGIRKMRVTGGEPLVRAGVGLSVVDNFTAEASLSDGLAMRPLKPSLTFDLHAMHLLDRPPSALASEFLGVLREVIEGP